MINEGVESMRHVLSHIGQGTLQVTIDRLWDNACIALYVSTYIFSVKPPDRSLRCTDFQFCKFRVKNIIPN